ncbi:hypothetical protein ACFCX0_42705 [Streptomyces sp. NPDC056352]|uniref:hypothetical protein n=1 Tax=Streptomyces sp. NPDC056352 TaxID=3345791 RepID=UPI0035DA8730
MHAPTVRATSRLAAIAIAAAAGTLIWSPAQAATGQADKYGPGYAIPDSEGYADRSCRSAIRGQLDGAFSWFVCWGYGEAHPGRNGIWYWTRLDDGAWGNVPAVDVNSGRDPASGLRGC